MATPWLRQLELRLSSTTGVNAIVLSSSPAYADLLLICMRETLQATCGCMWVSTALHTVFSHENADRRHRAISEIFLRVAKHTNKINKRIKCSLSIANARHVVAECNPEIKQLSFASYGEKRAQTCLIHDINNCQPQTLQII